MWQCRAPLFPFGEPDRRFGDLAGSFARSRLDRTDIRRTGCGDGVRIFNGARGDPGLARLDGCDMGIHPDRPQPGPGSNKRYANDLQHMVIYERRGDSSTGNEFRKGCRKAREGGRRPLGENRQAVATTGCTAGGSRTAITSGRSMT